MESKEFGKVTVYVMDGSNIIDGGPRVEINWSCTGAVSVEEAQAFANDLADAIDYATYEEVRLGIRKLEPSGHVCHACDGTGILD